VRERVSRVRLLRRGHNDDHDQHNVNHDHQHNHQHDDDVRTASSSVIDRAQDMLRPQLTVGMPCYDDFDGVWFSVQALRLYHPECMPRIEILVVDNHPGSSHGQEVRKFIEGWVPNGRYIAFPEATGTAAAKNRVFAEARGDAVLCMDSHVLLEPGALDRLLHLYDRNPNCGDLLHGPLVYDNLTSVSTHFNDEWRGEMWGIWASDPRGDIGPQRMCEASIEDFPPFEIPAQGMGLFSCRKEAWLGFNPHFRGFGGEEFYIHHKFRQAGRRTLCLPFLRWVHRFGRPRGVSYPLTVDDKFRNYVIGLVELGLPIEPAVEHFAGLLAPATIDAIVVEATAAANSIRAADDDRQGNVVLPIK